MNQTDQTRNEWLNNREILNRTSKQIAIESQNDDGSWTERVFSNEAAAQEYEAKAHRQMVPTRRPVK